MFRITDELGLIKKLKEGSHSAFQELYDEYFTRLCRYIFTFSHNMANSEEIVQQVMYKIWDNHSVFNITTSIQSYLFRACYNEFLNSKKRTNRLSTLDEIFYLPGDEEDYDYNNENELEKKEILRRVHQQIEKLPPRCKEVFILNKLDGLSYKEVAEKLNISLKTVEAQISTALRKIREVTLKDAFR